MEEILKTLSKMYDALKQLESRFKHDNMSNYELIVLDFIRRTRGLTGAVISSVPYSPEAILILSRSIFENAILFQALNTRRNQNEEEAVKDLFYANLIHKVKKCDHLKISGVWSNESDRGLDELKTIISKISIDKKKKLSQYGFLQKPLSEVCNEMGLNITYAILYRSASHVSHGPDINWCFLGLDDDFQKIILKQMTYVVEYGLETTIKSITCISSICLNIISKRENLCC